VAGNRSRGATGLLFHANATDLLPWKAKAKGDGQAFLGRRQVAGCRLMIGRGLRLH